MAIYLWSVLEVITGNGIINDYQPTPFYSPMEEEINLAWPNLYS